MLSASSRGRGAFGGCGHGRERGRIAFGGRFEDRSVAAGFIGIIDEVLKSGDSFFGTNGTLLVFHYYDYTQILSPSDIYILCKKTLILFF